MNVNSIKRDIINHNSYSLTSILVEYYMYVCMYVCMYVYMNELEYYITKYLLHSMVNIVENTVFFLLMLAKHLLKQVSALLFLH